MAEQERLKFMEDRDGIAGAMDFARRGIIQYRKAILRSRKNGFDPPHFASLPEYRRKFIESYCAFKKYISKHNTSCR